MRRLVGPKYHPDSKNRYGERTAGNTTLIPSYAISEQTTSEAVGLGAMPSEGTTFNMILIINQHGDRLCRDGRWRDFALFGNMRYCCKQYHSIGRAMAAAIRRNLGNFRICKIPGGLRVQAGSLCIETHPAPDQPGYVTYHHSRITDYVVYDHTSQRA